MQPQTNIVLNELPFELNNQSQNTSVMNNTTNTQFINSKVEKNSMNIQNSSNNSNGMTMDRLLQTDSFVNNDYEVYDDEELLKAFIGKNYDKITTKSYNFSGLFFSIAYMFYRKMFLYGLIAIILNIILSGTGLLVVSLNILICFVFNKIYLSFANKKINKIKLENKGKSIEEIKTICKRKGGTSIGLSILGTLINIIVTVVAIIIMFLIGLTPIFSDMITQIINGINGSTQNSAIDGVIFYDSSVIILDEFTIEVPDIFEETIFNSEYQYSYEYASEMGVDSCKVSLSAVDGYSSSEEFISQLNQYYNGEQSEFAKTTINDIEWNWFLSSNEYNTTYYYGMNKGDKVYLLQYSIDEDIRDICLENKNSIMNSIKVK